MISLEKIAKFLKNDWAIGFFLLLVFLAANGYTYAWDDQHVEIPLLKSLIDPSLYAGDYYVESLKHNFTSFLYPILARVISVQQVPAAYFILYLLSRYFLFFYAYKLWKRIAADKLTAVLCAASFILVARVEEFLYRTFSHQEFSLAIIMAGMYYFYKNRFPLAAVLFGIAANFHGLYSLFPFAYMAAYLLWNAKTDNGKTLFKSVGLFALSAAPFLIWTIKRFISHGPPDPGLYQNWLELYRIACPQNFLFLDHALTDMIKSYPAFLEGSMPFLLVFFLFSLNFTHNQTFRNDPKVRAILITAAGLLVFSFIFSYIWPSRFVLDLNLIRNLQYLQFFLIGYTTLLVAKESRVRPRIIAAGAIVLFALLRFNNIVTVLAALALIFLLSEKEGRFKPFNLSLLVLTLLALSARFIQTPLSKAVLVTTAAIVVAVLTLYLADRSLKSTRMPLQTVLILVPFFFLTLNYIYIHSLHLKIERQGTGFWQLQRNWIDMQNFVRRNTPKNSLLLVPNDMEMGGFRILSERKILVDYRDCGIVGFDYAAAVEWQKRLKDVEHFKVLVDGDVTPAIVNAVQKYKVNYIVFMNYMRPQKNALLEPLYANEVFALYKVIPNPI